MLQLVDAELPAARQEIEHELLRIRGEIEIRELYFSRLAAALHNIDRCEDAESEQTTVDWIRHNCRLTQQAASDRVRIGEKLPVMPRSENCLYTGEVGIQHLAVMARTAVAVGDAFDEARLLPLAKKHSPGRFYHESLHYRHSLRPKEVAEEQADLAENRHLSLSTAEDGCLILQGVLDPRRRGRGAHDARGVGTNLLGPPRRGCAGKPTTGRGRNGWPTPWSRD